MEKLLRQFAPFVALVVAAVLVVIANPADNGGSSNGEAAVAGTAATRTTTPTASDAALSPAEVPTDGAADSGAEPFAPSGASSVPSSFGGSSSGASSSSSFSTPSTGSSTPSFAAPATETSTAPPFTTPTVDAPVDVPSTPADVPTPDPGAVSDFYLFEPVKASAVCSAGGDAAKPLALAPSFEQAVIASEPSFPDRASGITFNKTDLVDPDRYLYRAHSLIANSSVSITDTKDNSSRILSQRSDWERLDGIVWTQNRTLLVGENIRVQQNLPAVPEFPSGLTPKAGVVYEVNPVTGTSRPLPMLGSKAHKGMTFDHLGNLYSVSATAPGYAYRFVPVFSPTGVPDYTKGTLSALWIGPGGESSWLQLNTTVGRPAESPYSNTLAMTDSDEAARMAGATALLSPEDVEMLIVTASSGARRSQLFIAETGANRVLTAVLRTLSATAPDNGAYVSTYVAPGVNAPKDFAAPSDLVLDTTFNLYIAERNGGGVDTSKSAGDDIWVAPANSQSAIQALAVGRVASVTDCDASPTGLMFDLTGSKLYLDLKGRGGDGRDLTVLITTAGGF
jgi:uncharacterized protein